METKQSRKYGVFFFTKNMSQTNPESPFYSFVAATHNEKRLKHLALGCGANPDDAVGINPERGTLTEPEEDFPDVPVAFKLKSVEQVLRELNISWAMIAAADVVHLRDGQAVHKAPEMRNSNSGEKQFATDMIEYLVDVYRVSHLLGWRVSFGFMTPDRQIISEPITVSCEFPSLNGDEVKNYLEIHASPGIDGLKYAKDKELKLGLHVEKNGLIQDLAHEKGKQLVVRSAPVSSMLSKIYEQPVERTSMIIPNLNTTAAFDLAMMKEVVDWYVRV